MPFLTMTATDAPLPFSVGRIAPAPADTEPPRVFLMLPRYGDVSMGAAKAFCAPNSPGGFDPRHQVRIRTWNESSFSLTPHCFNLGLCGALDARDRGEVTHFAMIHSDVEPLVSGWLNVLYREMVRGGYDLVSAVIPIKSNDGATSTAIGLEDDPWSDIRHIRLADRESLPTTVGTLDVCKPGEVLLVNTGLWLADLRRPWWDNFPGFGTPTRISRNADGTRRPQIRPEDWEMSRHLHAAGCRYAATWAVPLRHHGSYAWSNFPEHTS